MPAIAEFVPGSYRYIPGVFQYSGGVAAEPGFRIERVTFKAPLALKDGFKRAEAIIKGASRPLTAFCACELRSPAQFSEEGFRAFNRRYVAMLAAWGIFKDEVNPVARSNVCPEIAPPREPAFHAFSFTLKESAPPSFVIAGSGEVPEGKGQYGGHIVRRGETSTQAMREKAIAVMAEMERRLGLLGFRWHDTTAVQAYTVHDLHPFLASEIVRRGAARNGLTWHYCRPPVLELEFEMDCRGLGHEQAV